MASLGRLYSAAQASGGEVPLSTVADLIERREFATFTRIDGRQTALVGAEAGPAVITPLQARREISENLFPELQERYPGLLIDLEGSARVERTTMQTPVILVPLVLIAIYDASGERDAPGNCRGIGSGPSSLPGGASDQRYNGVGVGTRVSGIRRLIRDFR